MTGNNDPLRDMIEREIARQLYAADENLSDDLLIIKAERIPAICTQASRNISHHVREGQQ